MLVYKKKELILVEIVGLEPHMDNRWTMGHTKPRKVRFTTSDHLEKTKKTSY